MTPLVSILIPCHNAAPWLAATLDSALAQTWPRTEIILVDDGSTDESATIARRCGGARVKVLNQNQSGVCAALNHALRHAQGDYIEYLDADDLLHPDKLEIQIQRLGNLPSGWLASGEWARFENNPMTAEFTPEAIWCDLAPVDWLVNSWSGGGMMHGAAWLAPRKIAEAAGPWDERLTLINDLDYFTRLVLASEGVAFCEGARTYYRSGLPGSLSGRTSVPAWESAFLATELAGRALLDRENSPRTRQAAADNLQRLVHGAYPSVPLLVRAAEQQIAGLGGSRIVPGGGRLFRAIAKTLGWKAARRLQHIKQKRRTTP